MSSFVSVEAIGVERGKMYPLADFQRLTRMGVGAMRTARRSGLRVSYAGRQAFVSGDDFFTWIDQQAGRKKKLALV